MPEKPNTPPRLPDGAAVRATYSAAKGEWAGVLEVPGAGAFHATGRAVFTLLAKLDQRYRKWLRAEKPGKE